jgi:hypothetical protein
MSRDVSKQRMKAKTLQRPNFSALKHKLVTLQRNSLQSSQLAQTMTRAILMLQTAESRMTPTRVILMLMSRSLGLLPKRKHLACLSINSFTSKTSKISSLRSLAQQKHNTYFKSPPSRHTQQFALMRTATHRTK